MIHLMDIVKAFFLVLIDLCIANKSFAMHRFNGHIMAMERAVL